MHRAGGPMKNSSEGAFAYSGAGLGIVFPRRRIVAATLSGTARPFSPCRRNSLRLDGDVRPGGPPGPPNLDRRDITPVVARDIPGRSLLGAGATELAGAHVGPILPEKSRKPRQTRWNVIRAPATRGAARSPTPVVVCSNG